MKDFLFGPEQARTPIEKLSGGERGRLMLASALALPSNLIVLDEPTNDLDMETLDLLQELLGEYKGTILIVSHDRDFLDRVATSVIVSEGGGRWLEYAGGYSDMVAQRGFGLSGPPAAAQAAKPRRRAPRRSPRAPAKRKLTFNEKRALELLPERIDALRTELDALEAQTRGPGLRYPRADRVRDGDASPRARARAAGKGRRRMARAGNFARGNCSGRAERRFLPLRQAASIGGTLSHSSTPGLSQSA